MLKALVVGSNGQDGSFLVRHLLNRNYKVMGIARQNKPRWELNTPLFTYYEADLRKKDILFNPLTSFKPDLIFHFAAVHTSSDEAGISYEAIFNDMLQVNVASLHTILEYLRNSTESCLIYASSAKVFGNPLPEVISEETPKKDECLYSITKNTAAHLIDYYRKSYGAKASVVYLFNHESELRPSHFFIPKILKCLAFALKDSIYITEVNTLNFYCDWGSAEEYMSIVIDMLEKAPSEDFVLATGVCTHAQELVNQLFGHHGLRYERYVKEKTPSDKFLSRPYKIDLSKLYRYLNTTPGIGIYDTCRQILSKKYGL